MAKITGLGGVFYVVKDPEATRAWYRETLGIDGDYGPQLNWSEETGDQPYSLISHFKDDQYLKPGRGSFMINLRVDDLDTLRRATERQGCRRAGQRRRGLRQVRLAARPRRREDRAMGTGSRTEMMRLLAAFQTPM
ncbi:VOC family protein [Qipengyuania aquimaris]|uniref:VOC family protein n=1 Tax=Qipengyuania aquimaris TaxID=255984 RepID=UPI001F39879E|nr:VOC family protein [Qipengyuania aquimaris]